MNKTRYLILALVLLPIIMSCRHAGRTALQRALAVYAEAPNSALAILKGIDRSRLSDGERAMYALVYTASQDKSGLDVAGDSLIRLAYNHYSALPGDSLYGRCMYYMGKYYLLNDSIDRAVYCLQMAEHSSIEDKDTATQCMALEKLAKAMRAIDANKGLEYINKSIDRYQIYSKANTYNKVYLMLEKCVAISYCHNISQALALCKQTLEMAIELNDQTVISDVYQDMACFTRDLGQYDSAIKYGKLACSLHNGYNMSKLMTLALIYEKTDSLKQCGNILDTISRHEENKGYQYFHLRQAIAVKSRKYNEGMAYADSAFIYSEKQSNAEIRKNMEYYKRLMAEQAEKAQMDKKTSIYRFTTIIVGMFLICMCALAWLAYKNQKIKIQERIAHKEEQIKYEKGLREKEMLHITRLHQEEMKHKDIQIEMMRNFLLRKISVMEKLALNEGKEKSKMMITTEDWDEIEMFLESTNSMFVSRMRKQFPNLSVKDIRFAMLVRLNMTAKHVATIYGINEESVKHKLLMMKRKMGIDNEEGSARDFIRNY